MSRQILLCAFVALGATAPLACGGGDDSPEAILGDAGLGGVESGVVDLSVGLEGKGAAGGRLEIAVSGPFQGSGVGNLPLFEMAATAKGRWAGQSVDFEGGLTLRPNNAYVNYEGVDYEVDSNTFQFVESALDQARRETDGAESTGPALCQEELGQLDIERFFARPVDEGGAVIDGVETTKISGAMNVPATIDAVYKVLRTPACRTQLSSLGALPSAGELEEAKGKARRSIKRGRATVYVGDDGIVRKLELKLTVKPVEPGNGPRRLDADIELELSEVNRPQEIGRPRSSKPINSLLAMLGLSPIEVLEALQGEGGEEVLAKILEGVDVPDGALPLP